MGYADLINGNVIPNLYYLLCIIGMFTVAITSLFLLIYDIKKKNFIYKKQVEALNEYFQRKDFSIIEFFRNKNVPLIKYFPKKNNPVTNVKIIQYSCFTVIDTLKNLLRDDNCKHIDLLLFNPLALTKDDEDEFQDNRICTSLIELMRDHKVNPFIFRKMTVQMYDVPASIRGFNFCDEHIIMGCYIYFYEDDKIKILGHENPVISLSKKNKDFEKIKYFFNYTFDSISAKSIDITELIQNPKFQNCNGSEICKMLKDYLRAHPKTP